MRALFAGQRRLGQRAATRENDWERQARRVMRSAFSFPPRRARDTRTWRAATRAVVAVLLLLSADRVAAQPAASEPQAEPAPPTGSLGGFLGAVTRILAGQEAGRPVVAEAGGAEEAVAYDSEGIRRDETGLLDVHARDLDLATVLEMLSYEAQANIVATASVRGQISANLYGVTLEEALDAILTPNNFQYQMIGKTIYVGNAEEIAALSPLQTRVVRLRFIRPAEAAAAVKAVLSKSGSVIEGASEGKGGSRTDEMGAAGIDYIVVTDQAENVGAAEDLLRLIDERPKQVLIEATVLRATLDEANQFGIDFAMLGGVDFQRVNSTSNASADLTTGQLPAPELQHTTFNVNTRFAGNIQGGGFTFGLIKDSIAAFIRALEEVTDVVVVANPKIVALNKQQGEVIVGRRDGYLTTTVTETAAVQQVEFLETGTQIRFRPVINEDGTVRLSVHPKDSNGGLTAANLPFEETTEAHADLMVDDGDTLLIGGLFRERTVHTRSQIPVLGDLPGAGLLFGSQNNETVREEVIILLTVHIIKDTRQERDRHRALLEDVERIRVGSRRGLLGTGRERLAQAHYREALAQLERGHRGLATLNLRMTLHNQPKHLAAMRLMEQLQHERLWDEEGTRMRAFVLELVGAEPPRPEFVPPPFGRPRVLRDEAVDAKAAGEGSSP